MPKIINPYFLWLFFWQPKIRNFGSRRFAAENKAYFLRIFFGSKKLLKISYLRHQIAYFWRFVW
jgi:hypothetical protein